MGKETLVLCNDHGSLSQRADDTGAINRNHCRVTQRTIITRDCTYCPFPAPNIARLCFIAPTFPAHREPGAQPGSASRRPGQAEPPPEPGTACPGSWDTCRGPPTHPGVAGGCSGEGSPPQAARELAPQLTAIISQDGFRNRVQKSQEEDPGRSVANQTRSLGSSDVRLFLIPS